MSTGMWGTNSKMVSHFFPAIHCFLTIWQNTINNWKLEVLVLVTWRFYFFRYHVPRSWLKPTQNLLVLFEELGGDPTRISLVKRSVTNVCSNVAEYHPNIKNWQIENYGKTEEFHLPKVRIHCAPGQSISSIKFASFGTPLGTCGSFKQGTCHAPDSHAVVEKVPSATKINCLL